MIGAHWDISWHRSIGRDTFWTAPHLAIHLGGILSGLVSACLILSTTFHKASPLRAASVRIWGFRGPLGAFIMAWGGLCMITSAPFDNWWHNAYGLDVKILSPPHALLAIGIFAIQVGTLTLLAGQMNRAGSGLRVLYRGMFLYIGGMILIALEVLQMEVATRTEMHTAAFYLALSITAPFVLASVSRGAEYRWAATTAAAVYTAFIMLSIWILPLFPAEPKLGPVYWPVKQFVPPEFPYLFIVPAIALDLLWRKTRNWKPWAETIASATVFLAALAAAQWPFADFLMSPLARNWFFGTEYFGYYVHPGSMLARYQFLPAESGSNLLQQLALALVVATTTMWFGLQAGSWMRRIRR
jgi:hypothetical protein